MMNMTTSVMISVNCDVDIDGDIKKYVANVKVYGSDAYFIGFSVSSDAFDELVDRIYSVVSKLNDRIYELESVRVDVERSVYKELKSKFESDVHIYVDASLNVMVGDRNVE